jgi:hypothetical protein
MNRTGNGEGQAPLAGTAGVPVGARVTNPGHETTGGVA